jgi:MFS family permease
MVNNYLVVTLLNIGVTNPIQIALILGCCQFVVMLTVMSFAPDRFGRRPMLMLGAFLMGSALFVVGSISAATNNAPPPVMQRTTIGMFFVWALSFSTSWGPLSWTTMAETPSAALREKSMGLGAWAGFGVGMTVNFVQPYISAAIGVSALNPHLQGEELEAMADDHHRLAQHLSTLRSLPSLSPSRTS